MSTEEPGQNAPTEEQLRAAFEEQMRRITVPDVLVQTAVTLVNLGAQKLGEDGDLDQAKLAIEGTRALLPLLPDEIQTPIQDALSQLQMAFVQQAQGGGEPPPGSEPPAGGESPGGGAESPGGGAESPGGGAEPRAQEPADDAEREKARSKIWTPPGS